MSWLHYSDCTGIKTVGQLKQYIVLMGSGSYDKLRRNTHKQVDASPQRKEACRTKSGE